MKWISALIGVTKEPSHVLPSWENMTKSQPSATQKGVLARTKHNDIQICGKREELFSM